MKTPMFEGSLNTGVKMYSVKDLKIKRDNRTLHDSYSNTVQLVICATEH